MLSGKRFVLNDDPRFSELPELTKFKAKKMENSVGRGL